MKKTVITGAAGFLGSHLAKALLNQGYRVIGIDNMSTGRLENLAEIASHPDFRLIRADVSQPQIIDLPELADASQIYHLASPASPKFYQAEPFATIEVNTIGTRNMLELAKRTQASIVYAGTSEAYGDPLLHPQKEDYWGNVNTWGPRACYDEAKRLGEVYCYEYHQRFQVKVKVARLFNTYSAGLRNDDGRVISNFVDQALSGSELTVYGDGSQTRSFCYVDDTIAGLIAMMESKEANGQIINIGNPAEYSVLEVAELVIRLTGTDGRIAFYPLPEDDPKMRRPDIEKAGRLLRWKPTIGLEEGLKRTIAAYASKRQDGGGLQ